MDNNHFKSNKREKSCQKVKKMKDILSVITAYREDRGWTEYQLAARSGCLNPQVPLGTAKTWFPLFSLWKKSVQLSASPSLSFLQKKIHRFP